MSNPHPTRGPTRGKRRWGRKRVSACVCTYNFTCGPCLTQSLDRPKQR